jgi:hypothetical protein
MATDNLQQLQREHDEITARLASSQAGHDALVAQFAERLAHLEQRLAAGTKANEDEVAKQQAQAMKVAEAAKRHAAEDAARQSVAARESSAQEGGAKKPKK